MKHRTMLLVGLLALTLMVIGCGGPARHGHHRAAPEARSVREQYGPGVTRYQVYQRNSYVGDYD